MILIESLRIFRLWTFSMRSGLNAFLITLVWLMLTYPLSLIWVPCWNFWLIWLGSAGIAENPLKNPCSDCKEPRRIKWLAKKKLMESFGNHCGESWKENENNNNNNSNINNKMKASEIGRTRNEDPRIQKSPGKCRTIAQDCKYSLKKKLIIFLCFEWINYDQMKFFFFPFFNFFKEATRRTAKSSRKRLWRYIYMFIKGRRNVYEIIELVNWKATAALLILSRRTTFFYSFDSFL